MSAFKFPKSVYIHAYLILGEVNWFSQDGLQRYEAYKFETGHVASGA